MNTTPTTEVSFYIVAHADDWQLFMQPNAYRDIVSENNVVFIITTAGDGGMDERYWKAREEGLKSSVRFCIAPVASLSEHVGIKKINNHEINYWSLNNVKCYFLRLPDGDLSGLGYAKNNYRSLTRLKTGDIDFINAADSTTTYKGWADLCKTLEAIIECESFGTDTVWLNYLNPDQKINKGDHHDHLATGEVVQLISNISKVHQALFLGYDGGSNTETLELTDYFWKAGMFAAYEKCVFDQAGYSTLREGTNTYLQWCLRKAIYIIL